MNDFTLDDRRQVLLDASLQWALSPRTRADDIEFQDRLLKVGLSRQEIIMELRELQIRASEKLNGRRSA